MTEEELLNEMKNSRIKILNIEESLVKIKEEKKSICRFGDGELDLINGKKIGFQEANPQLAKRLEQILKSNQDFCFIGVPDSINNLDNLTAESRKFWVDNMLNNREIWIKYLREDVIYLTANLTRLYMRYENKENCGKYFSLLQSVWNQKDIVICEGEQTRMGIGNDLLYNSKSVRRIICPAANAFNKYDEILNRLKKENKDTLFLIALGPTATVLAYDLAKEGYQAIDIGHFDIEYEWFLRGSTIKEKIDNKYTNEVKGGKINEGTNDERYLSEIVDKIL